MTTHIQTWDLLHLKLWWDYTVNHQTYIISLISPNWRIWLILASSLGSPPSSQCFTKKSDQCVTLKKLGMGPGMRLNNSICRLREAYQLCRAPPSPLESLAWWVDWRWATLQSLQAHHQWTPGHSATSLGVPLALATCTMYIIMFMQLNVVSWLLYATEDNF